MHNKMWNSSFSVVKIINLARASRFYTTVTVDTSAVNSCSIFGMTPFYMLMIVWYLLLDNINFLLSGFSVSPTAYLRPVCGII
jgi:hypothetical protein